MVISMTCSDICAGNNVSMCMLFDSWQSVRQQYRFVSFFSLYIWLIPAYRPCYGFVYGNTLSNVSEWCFEHCASATFIRIYIFTHQNRAVLFIYTHTNIFFHFTHLRTLCLCVWCLWFLFTQRSPYALKETKKNDRRRRGEGREKITHIILYLLLV